MQQQETLLLVTDTNLPFGITRVAVLTGLNDIIPSSSGAARRCRHVEVTPANILLLTTTTTIAR